MRNHLTGDGTDGIGPRERLRSCWRDTGRRRTIAAAIWVLVAGLVGASWAGGGQLRDPAVSQLRQELETLKIAIDNRLGRVESDTGRHDRTLMQLERRLRDVEGDLRHTALLPRREPPLGVARELLDVRGVRAESFLVRDADGRLKATLALREGRPVLRLLGEDGREAAILEVTEDGSAALRLRDVDGALRGVPLQ